MSNYYVEKHGSRTDNHLWNKVRNYNELIEFLSSLKPYEYSEVSRQRIALLDAHLHFPSQKIPTILVGGLREKKPVMHFTSKLLVHEKYKTGCIFSSHFLSFNERIEVNEQPISNKRFVEVVNEVINIMIEQNIDATTYEVMLMSALHFFYKEGVAVALIEVYQSGKNDAACTFNSAISVLTNVEEKHYKDEIYRNSSIFEMMSLAKSHQFFISSEQSKLCLQKMKQWAEVHRVQWVMPIRKIAPLPYIYQQLYGHAASLASRIAHLFVEKIQEKFSSFLRGNLIFTSPGKRGRPSIEIKQIAQKGAFKTLKSFWNEFFNLPRGYFELLLKEKPITLLDQACSYEELLTFFLGIRLLHYQRPFKGYCLILALEEKIDSYLLLRALRYLLKKIEGSVIFVAPSQSKISYHASDYLTSLSQSMGIASYDAATFEDAFELSKTLVDERMGLVCVSGSPQLLIFYWHMKEVKKL